MNKNCLLCGVGGQGVVLASKLIAYAAMEKGKEIRTSETIGMAQRGGSVVSHVRMGKNIASPMIPKGEADLLIAFEPAEAVRNLSYLKEDGVVIVSEKPVQPVTATLGGEPYDGSGMLEYLKKKVKVVYVVDTEAVLKEAGSAKVLNTALLGAALKSGMLDIEIEDVEKELEKRVRPQYVEQNQNALELGGKMLCE